MARFLTPRQREKLLAQHKSERDGKVRDRLKAVLLANDEESFCRIAQVLFVDEQTVRRHVRDFLEANKSGNDSGGSGGTLTAEQSSQLKDLLASSDVPTAQSAADQAKGLFGQRFSVSGMTDWLKRNGFSYKKCEPVPAKADPAAQAGFALAYAKLKGGLPEGESIHFLDACHPTRQTKLAYAWSLKGARKLVKSYAGRERVNVVGTLDVAAMRLVTTFPERADGEAIAAHLRKLRRLSGTEAAIHVILDNGSYCRSHAVREAAAGLGIELVFLPPYSPNMNLIERLWRLMNEEVRDNVSFACSKDFEQAIKDFFQKRWRSLKNSCRDLFADNFQTLQSPTF